MDELYGEKLFEEHLKDIDKYAKKLGVSRQYFEEEFLLEGQLPDFKHYLRFKVKSND